jgi:hypothetical protein
MIEVFKTNVKDLNEASRLIVQMSKIFSNYTVNFDLEDCDRIMRVKADQDVIDSASVIDFLHSVGFDAEVL